MKIMLSNLKIFLVITELKFFLSHRVGLFEELAKQGCDITIFTSFDGLAPPKINGVKFHQINTNRLQFNLKNLLMNVFFLRKQITAENPDIIYAVSHRSIFLAWCSNIFLKVPSIFAISGLGSLFTPAKNFVLGLKLSILRNLILNFYRFFISKPNSMFLLQNDNDRCFLNNYMITTKGKGQTFLIPGSGLNQDFFSCKPYSQKKKIKFTMISRLLIDKGVLEFLNAAKSISDQFNNCEFTIYGDEDKANFNSIPISKLKSYLNSDIIYGGYISDIKPKIIDSSVIILPSYREGFSRVLMEAQACSRAVITSNVAGCRDVILENITGFLVETRNAIDLEEKMLEFIKNPNLIHEMGKNAYNHAHKNFSIKRSVDLHFEMFEKALNH